MGVQSNAPIHAIRGVDHPRSCTLSVEHPDCAWLDHSSGPDLGMRSAEAVEEFTERPRISPEPGR